MNKLRKARAAAQKQAAVPLHPFLIGVSDDTPFWRDLPDILQAQLLVMMDNGRPTKRNPTPRPPEKLLWAGTPHLRKRTILLLFVLWMFLLVVPSLLLVELVDEIGGWCAFGWALASVFIFVPRVSRGSREAFALTSKRVAISKRSMYCSIHTNQVHYSDISSATLTMHRDGSGTFRFDEVRQLYQPLNRVTLDRVRDVRGAVRVLAEVLPADVASAAGFTEGERTD